MSLLQREAQLSPSPLRPERQGATSETYSWASAEVGRKQPLVSETGVDWGELRLNPLSYSRGGLIGVLPSQRTKCLALHLPDDMVTRPAPASYMQGGREKLQAPLSPPPIFTYPEAAQGVVSTVCLLPAAPVNQSLELHQEKLLSPGEATREQPQG